MDDILDRTEEKKDMKINLMECLQNYYDIPCCKNVIINDLVVLFNGISTLVNYLMPHPFIYNFMCINELVEIIFIKLMWIITMVKTKKLHSGLNK